MAPARWRRRTTASSTSRALWAACSCWVRCGAVFCATLQGAGAGGGLATPYFRPGLWTQKHAVSHRPQGPAPIKLLPCSPPNNPGQWHGLPSSGAAGEPDDLTVASRVGRACYELYRASPSGVAPDSVRFTLEGGGKLPPRFPGQPVGSPAQPAAPQAAPRTSGGSAGAGGPEAAAAAVEEEQGAGADQWPDPARAPRRPRPRHAPLPTPGAPQEGDPNPAPSAEVDLSLPAPAGLDADSNVSEAQPAARGAAALQPEAEAAAVAAPPNAQAVPQALAQADADASAASGAAVPGNLPDAQASSAGGDTTTAVEMAASIEAALGGAANPLHGQLHSWRARSLLSAGDGGGEGLAAGGASGGSAAGATAAGGGAPPPPPPPAFPAAGFAPLTSKDFLRPEAAETLLYLWRATGHEVYREWGWSMFRAFERWCRVAGGGYAAVRDVFQVGGRGDCAGACAARLRAPVYLRPRRARARAPPCARPVLPLCRAPRKPAGAAAAGEQDGVVLAC